MQPARARKIVRPLVLKLGANFVGGTMLFTLFPVLANGADIRNPQVHRDCFQLNVGGLLAELTALRSSTARGDSAGASGAALHLEGSHAAINSRQSRSGAVHLRGFSRRKGVAERLFRRGRADSGSLSGPSRSRRGDQDRLGRNGELNSHGLDALHDVQEKSFLDPEEVVPIVGSNVSNNLDIEGRSAESKEAHEN